jgi:hypothetical protein
MSPAPGASRERMPWWRRLAESLRRMFAVGSKRYLCDSCKWDYGNACKRPERPNALVCPDYKRK